MGAVIPTTVSSFHAASEVPAERVCADGLKAALKCKMGDGQKDMSCESKLLSSTLSFGAVHEKVNERKYGFYCVG
jgi:hypothetical protein